MCLLCRMTDSSKKWQISIFSAVIFIVVIHPSTYLFTQKVLGGLLGKLADSSGCPTTRGLLLHTLVYILLIRGSMDLNLFTKWCIQSNLNSYCTCWFWCRNLFKLYSYKNCFILWYYPWRSLLGDDPNVANIVMGIVYFCMIIVNFVQETRLT